MDKQIGLEVGKQVEKQGVIDWEAFRPKDSDYIELKSGQKIKVGLKSVTQGMTEVEDEDESGAKFSKQIPCLNFVADYLDGKVVNLPFRITSKRLIGQLKRFDERGMLFSHVLEIECSGTGFQTQYSVFDCGVKPDALAFI